MSRVTVIHQPDFIPYIGFFHRLIKADLWIILDHVQFVNKGGSWHYRDKIRTLKGTSWLSIATQKTKLNTPISQVELSTNTDWRRGHINLIIENYRRAPFFHEIFPYLEALYAENFSMLSDFNLASITMINKALSIEIEVIKSTDLNPIGTKNEMLIDLLKKTNSEIYLSGVGAKVYMNDQLFNTAGIKVIYQDFSHPVYGQCFEPFIPYLTTIDLLFNCGINQSRQILNSL